MENDCIFCKIVAAEIPADRLVHNDYVTAFRDINPAAPTHILIIPNKHVASVNELTEADEILVGKMFTTARALAKEEGIDESGYRLILNTGPDGRQVVFHLHMHLIGGQRMKHPMG